MASRKARTTGPVETADPLKRVSSKAYGNESSGSAAVFVFSPVGNYAFAVRVDVSVGASHQLAAGRSVVAHTRAKLGSKFSELNDAKSYLSFIAYENEGDHINWHQHNEDRCRDATVYIVSMSETRTFGVRRVCEQHRICDKCNASCHADSKTLCAKCKANVKARKNCKTCESTPKQWTSLQPEHGSIIVLPHDYNVTHEHAVLGKQDVGGDKTAKGLRISINTKNIREEDIAYVERENRNGKPIPLSADNIHKGIAPGANKPRVYSIKRKHPQDAVYIGCAGSWKGCKCHAANIKSGSMYGNSYKPREFDGHFKHPIAKTPEEYREKLDKKWESNAPKDIAWKKRAIKELRGRNLLCWCLQPEDVDRVKITKPEGCHARVLFEYVNRGEVKDDLQVQKSS